MGYFNKQVRQCQQITAIKWYYSFVDNRKLKYTIFSVVFLVLSVSSLVGTVRVLKRSERLIEARRTLEELEKQKEDLKRELEFRNSPEFIEQEARNKLNMSKPGEELYIKPKIMGDDLLGADDEFDSDSFANKDTGSKSPATRIPTIFTKMFDKIRLLLLLFQS